MTTHSRRRKPAPQLDPRWIAFGQRLVKLRKQRGWRALDVARLIECDPATVSNIELGKRATGPERRTLEQLADLHGISIDELLQGAPSPYVAPPAQPSSSVFPPAGAPSLEPAALQAAIQDALANVLHDLLAALADARSHRAETAAPRQDRSTGTR